MLCMLLAGCTTNPYTVKQRATAFDASNGLAVAELLRHSGRCTDPDKASDTVHKGALITGELCGRCFRSRLCRVMATYGGIRRKPRLRQELTGTKVFRSRVNGDRPAT